MQKNALLMSYLLTLCSFLIFNSGCNGGAGESTFGSTAFPPPASSSAPVLPGTSNGLLDNNQYFYVGIDTKNEMISHVRSESDFKTPCAVNKDSTSNEDITCLIDAPEAELHNKDLELKFNVPPNMCRYLRREIYWFYNWEVGAGPSSINSTVTQTINASGDITATSYNCSFGGAPAIPCDTHPEIIATLTPDAQEYSCIYDKSGSDDNPNCCFGDYSISTTTIKNTPTASTSDFVYIKPKPWGGDYANCIGGPGKTNWSAYSKSNLPLPTIQYTQSGVTDMQIVTSPLSLSVADNIHVSNYFGEAADHTHTGFVQTLISSSLPYYIAPVDDRSGTIIIPSHDTYEFQCLDAGFEIKHRIRVRVRDWDTYPDFLTYISSEGTIAIPDRGLDPEPGTNCEAIANAGFYCNDFYDADDFLALDLGLPLYDTSAIANRASYFPYLRYR